MMRASRAIALILVAAAVLPLVVTSGPGQSRPPAPLATDGDASARPWQRYRGWPTRDSAAFNTLAKLASPPAPTEPRRLPGPLTGDPAIGEKLVADRTRGGSCLACHVM